jgi:hypothetical protein
MNLTKQEKNMKTLLALATLLTTLTAQAQTKHKLKMDWEMDGHEAVMEMNDYDQLVITLPHEKIFKPKAEITSNINMVDDCKVVAIKKKAKTVDVIVELGETNVDDGFNGCEVTIYRNHPSDEDGIGIVTVEFGYYIDG